MANYLVLDGKIRVDPLTLARLLNGMTHGQLIGFMSEVATELVRMDRDSVIIARNAFGQAVSATAPSERADTTGGQ